MSLFDMKLFRFLGFKKKPNAPWSSYYKTNKIEIPNMSLYEYFMENTKEYDDLYALDYLKKKFTYKKLKEEIDALASSLTYFGVKEKDIVTLCMPNTPEAIIAFFAISKIGAISNMVHPLSSENEIKNTIQETNSKIVFAIDMDIPKIKNIEKEVNVKKIVIVKASNSLSFIKNLVYTLKVSRKYNLPKKDPYIFYKEFLKKKKEINTVKGRRNAPAVIMHSGGSTGTPKGIVLSNGNFMALVEQSKIVFEQLKVQDKCLAIMPCFHGFGLGVCIYTPICLGAEDILIPKFNANEFDKILEDYKPEFVIGVPTLFEAMMKKDAIKDLSYLKYVISGGDNLKPSLESKINAYLKEHGAKVKLQQGYGMSECLAAVCLEPKGIETRHGIGIPFPGCYIGIFNQDGKECNIKEEGEICITGPNVMLGYLNNEKETNIALHKHEDGNIWLHSGDLGYMEEDGYFTYTSRLKRVIISSGYNVYPTQIEAVLESHEAVLASTVIGISHPYKLQVPKAYIVLKKGYNDKKEIEEELKELVKKNLPKYAKVYAYEFRKSLPRTLVGKVDFKSLQNENKEDA